MDKVGLSKYLESTRSIDAESKRRRLTLYFISYVGGTIMFLLAMRNLNTDNDLMVLLVGLSSLLVFSNAILSHIYKQSDVFYYIAGGLVIFMVGSVTYTGGYQNTGLFFVFPLLFIQIIIVGYKAAIAFVSVTMAMTIFMLFNQQMIPASYPDEQVLRFIISTFCFICVAFIGEHFWHQSHRELAHDNLEKLKQANTDPLTKLPNRRFLESVYFERAMQNPADYFPLSLVMVDADHFKQVNDNYGHDTGDKVLKHFADMMRQSVRSSDVVARTGGEEFLILYPQTTLSQAIKLANAIREKIAETPFIEDEVNIALTASFGVETALTDNGLHASLKHADDNLYEAKQRGRNRVV